MRYLCFICFSLVILNINNHDHETPYGPYDDTYNDLSTKWCSWYFSPRNMLKSKEAQTDNSYLQAIEDISIKSFKHLIHLTLQSQSEGFQCMRNGLLNKKLPSMAFPATISCISSIKSINVILLVDEVFSE